MFHTTAVENVKPRFTSKISLHLKILPLMG